MSTRAKRPSPRAFYMPRARSHARPRRSRRCLSGHRSTRTRARHHHLCQAGGARLRRHAHHAARYAGPRRFLRRSRAHPAGARLRDPCHQRHGRRAGPPARSGGCWSATACRRSSSSTRWTLRAQTRGAADGSAKEFRRVRRSRRRPNERDEHAALTDKRLSRSCWSAGAFG